MGSKKHYSPRYHKHRDLSRLSASASGNREHYRFWKSYKHGVSRSRNRSNLTSVTKAPCLCECEEVTSCPRCDSVDSPPKVNRRTGCSVYADVKHLRWLNDKLAPGIRWSYAVSARHGERVLEARLRKLPGVAGNHLAFHIRNLEAPPQPPVCSVKKLARTFASFGLTFSPRPKHLLREVAQLAWTNNTEHRLSKWTSVFAGSTTYADGHIRQSSNWCPSLQEAAEIHVPLRKTAAVSYKINDNWRRSAQGDWQHATSDVYRPLHSAEDINTWAQDLLGFFDAFYGTDYFHTAYGRWVLRYTLSFLTEIETPLTCKKHGHQ